MKVAMNGDSVCLPMWHGNKNTQQSHTHDPLALCTTFVSVQLQIPGHPRNDQLEKATRRTALSTVSCLPPLP